MNWQVLSAIDGRIEIGKPIWVQQILTTYNICEKDFFDYAQTSVITENAKVAAYICTSVLPVFDIPMGDLYPFPINCGNNWCYFDESGNRVISLSRYKVLLCRPFSEGLAAVALSGNGGRGRWGYIDNEGKFAIDATFSSASEFSEGQAVVGIADPENGQILYGAIDKKGEYVIRPYYVRLFPLREGIRTGIILTPNGKSKSLLLDSDGILISEFPDNWEVLSSPCNGLILVNTGNGYAFLDKELNMTLNLERKWDEVHPFSCGFAPVRKRDLWGYIDQNGDVKFPVVNKDVLPFYNDVACVLL